MSEPQNEVKNSYEVSLRLLGNEVFAIGLKSSDNSNRWIAIGLITAFCFLTILGAYGDKLVNMFKSIT